MSNEEKAKLNYLLTLLRCQIEDFITQNMMFITSDIEEEYEYYISAINDLLQLSIVDGDEK